MISHGKRTSSFLATIFCALILAMLLVACTGGTTSTPPSTPTAKPSPTPTPTPALTVYTGKGYAIGYPQGWKVTPSDTQVDFTDATEVYHVTIMIESNSGGAIDASTLVNSYTREVSNLLIKSCKQVEQG